MKKENIPITVSIVFGFCVMAYIANIFTNCNYMFLSRGDGTPYDIVFNAVNGNKVIYPLAVFGMFIIYIAIYYLSFYKIQKRKIQNN